MPIKIILNICNHPKNFKKCKYYKKVIGKDNYNPNECYYYNNHICKKIFNKKTNNTNKKKELLMIN